MFPILNVRWIASEVVGQWVVSVWAVMTICYEVLTVLQHSISMVNRIFSLPMCFHRNLLAAESGIRQDPKSDGILHVFVTRIPWTFRAGSDRFL